MDMRWFVAAAACVLVSCGSDNSGTAVSATSGTTASGGTASTKAPDGPKTFEPGQTIRSGDNLLLTVSAATVKADSGNPYITPGPGNIYLLVPVAFDNQGAKPVNVSSFTSFELHDETGQQYTETVLPDQPNPPDGMIAPKDKLAGTLIYAVPAGKAYRLYFKGDIFGSGQVSVDLGSPK